MNKNIIIGILVVVVLGALGYALYKSPSGTNVYTPPATTDQNSSNPTPISTSTTEPSAPAVTTSKNAGTSISTANVTGLVIPNGAPTTYWFDYGETTALGSRTNSQIVGSGYVAILTPGFISGLKANTTYYFRLNAQNRIALVNGDTYSFKTNNNPPVSFTAPTTQSNGATDITRNTANLNGHVNPNGFQTTYWFEYGTNSNLGSVTAFQSAGSGNVSNSVAVSLSNLLPLTKYYFRLNAQNQFGTVNGAILNFTTAGPAAPTSPTVDTTGANKISSSSATFNGRINPNGATTTYWFEYGTDSALGSLIGKISATGELPAGTSNVSVSLNADSLHSNTQYYYRLVGQNQYGTVRGDIVLFKTKS